MRHPQWSYDAVLYEMNIRQLTTEGTLRAAAEQLPRLAGLGIDAVWLMPVYPIGRLNRKGSLGSYYSIADYCDINPEIGTLVDFDYFVDKAHSLGIKVILDWVANHTARDAKWLTDKPADWYKRDENGNALIPWDWSDTAQLNYDNRDVWQGQIEAMKFWVTEHNIDGFRCDMAMLVPIEFWQVVRFSLQQIKPDIFLLAARELGLPAKACAVVEDAKNGILAAHRAGCYPILVPDLYPPAEEILPLLWHRAGSLWEIPALVRAHNEGRA